MTEVYITGAGVYRSEAFHKGKEDITPIRTVEQYEIEFFRDNFHYGFIDNKKIEYKKNTVLIAKPGCTRYSKKHFSCYFVHVIISDKSICELLKTLPDTIHISDETEYVKLFQKISMGFPATDASEILSLNGRLMLLLSALVRDSKPPHANLGQIPEIQKSAILSAKAFTSLNYRNNIKLCDIAESTHLTPNYFHKLFSSACGYTPLEHLTKVRLENAKLMLLNTEETITHISEECGFNSYNYFCTVFKKFCGMTPLEFRRKGIEYYDI